MHTGPCLAPFQRHQASPSSILQHFKEWKPGLEHDLAVSLVRPDHALTYSNADADLPLAATRWGFDVVFEEVETYI